MHRQGSTVKKSRRGTTRRLVTQLAISKWFNYYSISLSLTYHIFASNAQMIDYNCVWRSLFSDCVPLTSPLCTVCLHWAHFHRAFWIHCKSISSISSNSSWELDHILWENLSIWDSVIYVTGWELMSIQWYARADFSHTGTQSAKH